MSLRSFVSTYDIPSGLSSALALTGISANNRHKIRRRTQRPPRESHRTDEEYGCGDQKQTAGAKAGGLRGAGIASWLFLACRRVTHCTTGCIASGVAGRVARSVAGGVARSVAGGVARSVAGGVARSVAGGIA